MGSEKKEVVRRPFRKCLRRAKSLLDVMARQTCTDPTYSDLLDIMSLRSGLEDESLHMEEKLNYFLQYDMVFINEAIFLRSCPPSARSRKKLWVKHCPSRGSSYAV